MSHGGHVRAAILALAGGVAIAAGTAMADVDVPEFTAHYDVYAKGFKAGESTLMLASRGDGRYTFRSESNTTGLARLFRRDRIVEESLLEAHDGHLRSLEYHYRQTGGRRERETKLMFDWDAGSVRDAAEDERWDIELPGNALDKMGVRFAVMIDLAQGDRNMEYTIADDGELDIYRFETVGEETVDTPLGRFETIKVRRAREDSDRQTIIWSAPALNYLPVRMEQHERGDIIRAELRELEGIDHDAEERPTPRPRHRQL